MEQRLSLITLGTRDLERAIGFYGRSGARIARGGASTFWGGYSGIFVDLDGHPWEVAHNPAWGLADDGSVSLDV